MQIKEAINALNDGHTIWKVGYAKRVCKALGVPFNEKALVESFHSDWTPDNFKGLRMTDGYEGSLGVYSLNLSHYVAEQLGVDQKAQGFIGRGSQAREYARVVAEKLGVAS